MPRSNRKKAPMKPPPRDPTSTSKFESWQMVSTEGGIASEVSELLRSEQNLMIERAMRSAEKHGIRVSPGHLNKGDGNCAFESAILNVNERQCFKEKFPLSVNHYRRVWVTDMKNRTMNDTNWKTGSDRDWEAGWDELLESGVYERGIFGDLMLLGIACGLRKFLLIFNTSLDSPHDPIYVCDPRNFGVFPDTDIPVILCYNLSHYENLLPNSKSDQDKSVNLVKQYIGGEYQFCKDDLAFLLNIDSDDRQTIKEIKGPNLERLEDALPDHLKERRISQMTKDEKREYRFHRKNYQVSKKVKIEIFDDDGNEEFDFIKEINVGTGNNQTSFDSERNEDEKRDYKKKIAQEGISTVKVKNLEDNPTECETIVDNIVGMKNRKQVQKNLDADGLENSSADLENEEQHEKIYDIALNEMKLRMEEIKSIKVKERTETEKNELHRLKMKILRKNMITRVAENEKESKRKRKIRENKEKRNLENEKKAKRIRIVRENAEKRRVEKEKEAERKRNVRQDNQRRSIENKKQLENKKKTAQIKRSSHRMIAANVTQDKFQEKEIDENMKSSYLGNLMEESNQCKKCDAYRFKNERNFCCSQGDIVLPTIPEPPEELRKLFEQKKFTDNIRGYNNILAMASIGCTTPESVRGPNFKIQGKVYHKIGSLLPSDAENPKFLQLYFYDNDEATNLRHKIMPKLSKEILRYLTKIIEENNSYIKSFKSALEYVSDDNELSLVLLADKKKIPAGDHSRRYNLPQGSEVAAIMPGEGEGELEVLVKDRENKLSKIKCTHRSYDPLLYVVFDPYGTDGFSLGLKRVKSKRNVSIADFYSYRIQVRPGYNPLLRSKRCFQQYLVDQGAKIEGMRMKWVENHQKTIKAEKYNGLIDAAAVGDLAQAGRKIILPPSITGSPRFYVEKYQDCMAIVQKFGKPTLFITMTCNPEWKEIQDALNPGETAFDRPDICTRVFKLKNDLLLDEIEKKEIFGKVKAMVGTIEQQKRKGLHHSHNLIILESEYVPKNPEDIDKIVCAEIPDPETNPELYSIITQNNIHGPCGKLKPNSPCMEANDKGLVYCTKEFPKDLQKATTVTEYSYPKYRRRSTADGGRTVVKLVAGKPVVLDNGYVVPYNCFLSLKFNCHINVEIVVSVVSVKYIYKYITKGPDRCIATLKTNDTGKENKENSEVINEVENFTNARYLGASESVLKIFKIPIHYRSHSVVKLACHLPGEQAVLFEEGHEGDALERGEPSTTLTAFFEKNKHDETARNFLYTEFPGYFTYSKGKWQNKKQNIGKALGRIPTVSLCAKTMETYSLRILLNHIRGPTCYDDLKTVDGVVSNTFQEACQKLGLLEDDSEIEQALREACSLRFGDQLILFFGSILEFCRPGDPLSLWETFKKEFFYHYTHTQKLSDKEAENFVLNKLKQQLGRSGCTLKEFKLPEPDTTKEDAIASLIVQETSYDKENLLEKAKETVRLMNDDQLDVFNDVIASITSGKGKMFCLNAAGGTGKTFVLNALLDAVRGDGFVALATASSGVAAQLMPNGTTVHSRFKVPINVQETSTCNFTSRDATGRLISMTKLIIIDEMTMQHKFVYECIDRSLRELISVDAPFGGITVVFSGDWRQCLPIVKHGGRGEIVNACLRCSYLWKKITVKNLTRNMRVQQSGDSKDFSDLLLKIGDGNMLENENMGENMVKLPEELFLNSSRGDDLVDEIFPEFQNTYKNISLIKSRAILCPTNEECRYINKILLEKLPGEVISYKSCDSVNDTDAHMYPQEFLNTIDLPGIPPHLLELKVGAVVILLRNLNPSEGHVNGTRYVIQNLLPHVIDVTAISGSKAGAKLFIPRIWLSSKDPTLPFEMKRKQFPLKLAYSMTANKAQGQTLDKVGIYLGREFFSHGQLYVAISRVGNANSVKIIFKKENNHHVKNVVYKEVLN